jgi:hypothetical protein
MKDKGKGPNKPRGPIREEGPERLPSEHGDLRYVVEGTCASLYPLRFRIAAPRQKLACDYEERPQVAKRHGIWPPGGFGRPGFFQARGVPFLLTLPGCQNSFARPFVYCALGKR